jgi:FkbM family methyltransferase
MSAPDSANDLHARALLAHEAGRGEEALSLLREAARWAVDIEVVNDLAVVTAGQGDVEEAAALLRGVLAIAPENTAARDNLDQVDDPAAGLRARLLQMVLECRAERPLDNFDHFFAPMGVELPDPAGEGERLAELLALLPRMVCFWQRLGDDASREVFLRFLAHRVLGPVHVRLQLEPAEYRGAIQLLNARLMEKPNALPLPGIPLEWMFNLYDLRPAGVPVRVIGQPLPLASTFVLGQYAYRDGAVDARPHAGDVALDVGGCWGDTALFLAAAVGSEGRVISFEPTPANRDILTMNLSLNPELATRISVCDAAASSSVGELVYIPNRVSAGATVRNEREGDDMVALQTVTIDALVAEGTIPRVDFLKVDVEGADLGVLEGAAETIRSMRPRLALACYHKPDDLATLPGFVNSLGVEYRWYLQCSTMTPVDTVAFGVPVDG